jgi:hypothetical protein
LRNELICWVIRSHDTITGPNQPGFSKASKGIALSMSLCELNRKYLLCALFIQVGVNIVSLSLIFSITSCGFCVSVAIDINNLIRSMGCHIRLDGICDLGIPVPMLTNMWILVFSFPEECFISPHAVKIGLLFSPSPPSVYSREIWLP